MLRQVALNLVSNAIKFTDRGKINLHALYDIDRELISLTVSDTGIGIPEERLSEIFEPFRQVDNSYAKRYAGTGLGLSISKKQVEALGGTIVVESTPGQGTTFEVTVPVGEGAHEQSIQKAGDLFEHWEG